MKFSWKEWVTGFGLMCIVVPLAIIGYFLIVIYGFMGRANRVRQGVRAMDHFVNATVFNGYAWESVSSHAWRERDNKKWARRVIAFTDYFQQDHCKRANKREQPIVDLALTKGLEKQTIK